MANEHTTTNGMNSKNKVASTESGEDNGSKRPTKEVHHHHYYGRGFNFGKLFFGLLVIFFGLYYLARNTGWLPIDLQINWILVWPILIIFAGLSLLTGRSWLTAIIGTITTIIVILAVVLMLFGGQIGGGKTIWPFLHLGVADNYYNSGGGTTEQAVVIAKEQNAKAAIVSMKTRAGKISIKGGGENLISGKYSASYGKVATSSNLDGNSQTVTLETFAPGSMMMFGSPASNLILDLTTQIPVKAEISAGASDLELDLTRVVLEQLEIDAGASSIKLALGDKAKMNQVKIKAGASSIEVEVPRTAGVKIVLDSALGSLNLEGFDKIDDRNYQTSSYERSDKKIDLSFELGISSLRVRLK